MVITGQIPRCVVCDAERWIELPEVGPYSMASDWRVVQAPLRRCACAGCGLVRSLEPAADPDMFVRDYLLYAHPPTDPYERQRQEQYATWIGAAVEPRRPRRVLDVGCGNGSLLLALGKRWPAATLLGCDLSLESVKYGLDAGITAWALSAADLPQDVRADVVLTVNVIEHAADPVSLLRTLQSRATADGLVIVVCPDGAKADVELLMSDHVHSFAREHLEHLLARAGLAQRLWSAAPPQLGAFQMLVAEPNGQPTALPPIELRGSIVQDKAAYLRRWRELDEPLLARLGRNPVVSFGMGETAGLLRAYAPRTWGQVRACTDDRLVDSSNFAGLPAVPLADVPTDHTVLIAVRPQDQQRVAAALDRRFTNVVTWYDLVARN